MCVKEKKHLLKTVSLKGMVSRDFPAQTAYIVHLQITSLFMDKKDLARFCKLAQIFACLSDSSLCWTALSEFFSLGEPYNFIIKNYWPQLKEHSYEILCF